MNTRTARRLRKLAEFHRSEVWLEKASPGIHRRNPIGPIRRIGGGWQWGWHVAGYGNAMGYCLDHKPHKTRERAAACGSRFLAGIPSWQVWR